VAVGGLTNIYIKKEFLFVHTSRRLETHSLVLQREAPKRVFRAGVQVHVQQAYRYMYSSRTGVCTAGVQVHVQQAHGCMYGRRTDVCTAGVQVHVQQAYRCKYSKRTGKGTVYVFLRLPPPVHWLNFAFTYIETGLRYIHNKLSSGIGVQY